MKRLYQCEYCNQNLYSEESCLEHEARHQIRPLANQEIVAGGYGERRDINKIYPTILTVTMTDGAVGTYELISPVKK